MFANSGYRRKRSQTSRFVSWCSNTGNPFFWSLGSKRGVSRIAVLCMTRIHGGVTFARVGSISGSISSSRSMFAITFQPSYVETFV